MWRTHAFGFWKKALKSALKPCNEGAAGALLETKAGMFRPGQRPRTTIIERLAQAPLILDAPARISENATILYIGNKVSWW